jgi:hypothetical protein
MTNMEIDPDGGIQSLEPERWKEMARRLAARPLHAKVSQLTTDN